jgi:hypothetical protein
MSKQMSFDKSNKVFPSIIEYKLSFLKLNRNGKIRLTVFNDKTLYKAIDKIHELYDVIPDNPFNIYYALCIFMVEKLNCAPNWNESDEYNNFDSSGEVTLDNEFFEHQLVADYLKEFRDMNIQINAKPKQNYKKKAENNSSAKYDGPTFNRGIMYFKYGQWFRYPDTNWDRNSRPSLPVSSSQAKWLIDRGINPKDVLRKALKENLLAEEQIDIFHLYESPMMKEFLKEQSGERPRTNPASTKTKPRMAFDDERRYNLNPVEELKKAIRTGRVSKKGLVFLRDTYLTYKPELIPIIDEFLGNPDAPCAETQVN